MDVCSTTKHARISPKKARDVAREIQGLPVSDALDTLAYTPKKAAQLIGKTLKSAIANAENNHELIADEMVVKEAVIGEGPTLKRFKPRARGSAGAILKRTSHIYITLTDEIEAEEDRGPRISRKDKKRHKVASLFGAAAKAAPKEEAAVEADPSSLDLGQVYEAAPEQADDLKEISGVGPALEEKLNGFGVYTYAQIAAWNETNIAAFDQLLSFKGRIERDNWLQQAADLEAAKGSAE